jgi:N-acetylmuramoyl-L-alanine amidase
VFRVDNVKLRKWEPFMAVILLVLVYVVSSHAGKMTAGVSVKAGKEKPVIVIDAGHGGNDPGKIGIDGTLEKDINLQIAYRLKKYLEASDVDVVLTRKNDNGLYTERDSRKKMADMTKRCDIINGSNPDLTVSIHQNSYHQEEISGGQVFYYKKSEKGKRLAEIIQERFDYVLGDKNTRLAKPNDNYYLLLHVKSPIVIVECGFLTNWKEAASLNSEEYQDRVAWTIHMGIMEYLNGR